jgi:hypothetical protein
LDLNEIGDSFDSITTLKEKLEEEKTKEKMKAELA